jgi:hypothetical protein
MLNIFTFIVLMLLIFSLNMAMAQSEEESVITTVQNFFSAMSARDTAATGAVLLPEGQYFSIKEDSSTVTMKKTTHQEYLARLATSKENWLEKMREPEVWVHGRVAILWAKYDFYRNGKFSHCGVDAFSLLKGAEGWKIVGFVFNKEKESCHKKITP